LGGCPEAKSGDNRHRANVTYALTTTVQTEVKRTDNPVRIFGSGKGKPEPSRPRQRFLAST
jgi:hypothetical protein